MQNPSQGSFLRSLSVRVVAVQGLRGTAVGLKAVEVLERGVLPPKCPKLWPGYTYIYTHIYIYIYIHTSLSVYVYIHIHTLFLKERSHHFGHFGGPGSCKLRKYGHY